MIANDCDACFACGTCGKTVCAENETDCGHDDTPTCASCCPVHHADELIREALRGWGLPTAAHPTKGGAR